MRLVVSRSPTFLPLTLVAVVALAALAGNVWLFLDRRPHDGSRTYKTSKPEGDEERRSARARYVVHPPSLSHVAAAPVAPVEHEGYSQPSSAGDGVPAPAIEFSSVPGETPTRAGSLRVAAENAGRFRNYMATQPVSEWSSGTEAELARIATPTTVAISDIECAGDMCRLLLSGDTEDQVYEVVDELIRKQKVKTYAREVVDKGSGTRIEVFLSPRGATWPEPVQR